jgi:large subunit ribosomal protein L32
MAAPVRKTSVQRKRKRRTHFKLALPGLVTCPSCGKQTQSHRVCKHCGHYDGRKAV